MLGAASSLGLLHLQSQGFPRNVEDWYLAYFKALLVTQVGLSVVGGLGYSLMPKESRNVRPRKILYAVGAVVYFIATFYLSIIIALTAGEDRKAQNQWSAVGSLRTINTVEITYAHTYRDVFSADLKALDGENAATNFQGDCNKAALIESLLASGTKSGYSFEYRPGSPIEKPPPDCPLGVKSYMVTARPLQYRKTGKASYFTDESGVIRWTEENRPATSQDPPLAG